MESCAFPVCRVLSALLLLIFFILMVSLSRMGNMGVEGSRYVAECLSGLSSLTSLDLGCVESLRTFTQILIRAGGGGRIEFTLLQHPLLSGSHLRAN